MGKYLPTIVKLMIESLKSTEGYKVSWYFYPQVDFNSSFYKFVPCISWFLRGPVEVSELALSLSLSRPAICFCSKYWFFPQDTLFLMNFLRPSVEGYFFSNLMSHSVHVSPYCLSVLSVSTYCLSVLSVSFYPSIFFVCLSLYLSFFLSFFCLSLYLSFFLSFFCLSFCLSFYVYLFLYLTFILSVFISCIFSSFCLFLQLYSI